MPSINENNSNILTQKKRLNESRWEARLYYGFGVDTAKAIKVCTECGTMCKANDTFCTECRARLPVKNLYELSIEDAARCPHCRAILAGGENYCPICGKEISAALCDKQAAHILGGEALSR